MTALPHELPEEGEAAWEQALQAEGAQGDAGPVWALNGDQYELFGLPPGPSQAFRQLLGQSAPPPELLTRPEEQYEIFPELAAALTPKPPPPPGMVEDGELGKLQHVLEGVQSSLVLEDEPKPARPDFGPPESQGPAPEGRAE